MAKVWEVEDDSISECLARCKNCLSYHPLSKWAGWCGLWRTAAISDQICIAWKERPSAKDGEPDHDDVRAK